MAAIVGQARQQTIRFDEFELDLSGQTLFCQGVRTKLQKQPFQVLELLIRRAPAIVSREEIRRHVWGDAVHIDAPQSINFCIRQIRFALCESAAGPRFIETLPRQGYRFIAHLEVDAWKAVIPGRPPVRGLPSLSKTRWLMLGVAILLVLSVLAAVWRFTGRNTAFGVVRISPVTTYPGDERDPAISPDGRQVAFSWGGEKGGNRDIYITALGKQHAVRLTSDPAEDMYPAWSPNGQHIAFIRRRPRGSSRHNHDARCRRPRT